MMTLAISVSVLVIIVGARRINNKIPGALIAVIGAIAASYFFDLSADGVAVLGTVPSGLPKIGLPDAGVDWSTHPAATAHSLFIVCRDPGPKCGHLPCLRRPLQRAFQRECRSGRSRAWPISAPA